MREKSIAYQKAFDFSVEIVDLYKYLVKNKKEYVLSKQLLRSGTSIAGNIKEGIYGQSKSDFISKLSIALKEASETEYWIELLVETDYLQQEKGRDLTSDVVEIIKILTKSLKTAKKSRG
ncbi:four helix bundle protein [Natroniella sulfidigena]|uniref:four helix bundle protein n=1 Tax=Natroniella sulfidigena TaxID=723921 RepID=UPI00200AEB55|nr:four helix bundle protein [Natroniella sulfidigena]MCK8817999.1 four helix bundle protein [Natroniella sulfidigena]